MKRIIFCSLFLSTIYSNGQNGLENIIVEKYYVSDENDTISNSYAGKLPVGSTTYRIYADMLPGYRFQAAYGSSNHELFIKTSTLFFNNEDRGNPIANVMPQRNLGKNTVMLDSWLSVGAAGEDYFGILKQDDDSLETVIHEKTFLQNNSFDGIPLTVNDGLKSGDNVPRPTFYNIDSAVAVFNNTQKGGLFQTKNGAWACMGVGSVGIDSLTNNRVLIAQITTNGELTFELNIQIGTPVKGVSQNYVARNPINKEILLPSLIFNSEDFNSKKFHKKNKKNTSSKKES